MKTLKEKKKEHELIKKIAENKILLESLKEELKNEYDKVKGFTLSANKTDEVIAKMQQINKDVSKIEKLINKQQIKLNEVTN